MKYYQQILDDLCKQKDIFCEGLPEEEIKEIDTYLEEVVKEMASFLENVDHIAEDPQKKKTCSRTF
jgi:hypothetical protein